MTRNAVVGVCGEATICRTKCKKKSPRSIGATLAVTVNHKARRSTNAGDTAQTVKVASQCRVAGRDAYFFIKKLLATSRHIQLTRYAKHHALTSVFAELFLAASMAISNDN
ncbi:hypothetical protein NQX30_04780 [Candidatus Persebacteraceae bacterium Df01]|uniref:Transposase n=1 Tax=Candidatus Doriopsillibacter californiensis TaxID=2970740 RepID=A0ABT7QM69_9GAMM|nr:hypothetical protein [Candidatus Persebacteraceae bacterium Df01]